MSPSARRSPTWPSRTPASRWLVTTSPSDLRHGVRVRTRAPALSPDDPLTETPDPPTPPPAARRPGGGGGGAGRRWRHPGRAARGRARRVTALPVDPARLALH